MKCRFEVLLGVLAWWAMTASNAWAWHPATTQAGLAEKAALASRLHEVLTSQLHRPLGLFEPVTVAPNSRTTARLKNLWRRLAVLDPSDGNTATDTGANMALFWLSAGAILESTPATRERHHFYDPQTQRGLQDNPGLSGFVHSLRLAVDGSGGLRGLATGTSFNLTGSPALNWFMADDNELGLGAFLDAWEATVSAQSAAQRDLALADALMCMGALGALLGDVGEPAHVRNDFRGAFLDAGGGAGPWDRSSDLERFVAQRYGRAGVPAPVAATQRPSFAAYFTGADKQGLADLTQAQFFSAGTIPAAVAIDAASTPKEVRMEANRSLAYPKPEVGPLKLRTSERQYQMQDGRRQLAYERLPGSVRFYLDEAVYADTAAAWLPVVGGYVAGLFNDLVRVQVHLAFKQSQAGATQVTVSLQGLRGSATGLVKVYADDAQGVRGPVGAPVPFTASASEPSASPQWSVSSSAAAPSSVSSSAPAASSGAPAVPASPLVSLTVTLPPGASQVAVSVRGQDAVGAFVGVASGSEPER